MRGSDAEPFDALQPLRVGVAAANAQKQEGLGTRTVGGGTGRLCRRMPRP
jgi:hypothetical protein